LIYGKFVANQVLLVIPDTGKEADNPPNWNESVKPSIYSINRFWMVVDIER